MKYAVGGYSDKGNFRELNQDRILYLKESVNDKPFILAAICDGVGGSDHGEQAAELVIKKLNEWFEGVRVWLNGESLVISRIFPILMDTIDICNSDLREYCSKYHIKTATTMSVLLIVDSEYCIVHVGDSRIYRITKGLELLTEDQVGVYNEDFKNKQYLSNYIGKTEEIDAYVKKGRLQKKDVFALASDGFYHNFFEDDSRSIYKNAQKNIDLIELSKQWVYTMENRGERDNVSLIIVRISDN